MPDIEYYTGAYTGEEIDEAIGKAVSASNPNLLVNWYMVGGGNADGVFPINQRGYTQYNTANAYCIDMWANTRGNTVDLVADGVKLNFDKSLTYQQLAQPIENYRAILGKQVTLSVLSDATVECYIRAVYSDNAYQRATIPVGTNKLTQVTFTVPTNVSSVAVQVSSMNYTYSSGYITIKAVKLELGNAQTLATKVNNVWQITEIPNYQQELVKCRRYLWVMHGGASNALIALGGANSTTSASFLCVLPSAMRYGTGTIINTGGVPRVYAYSDGQNKNASAISLAATTSSYAIFESTCSGLSAGQLLRLLLMNGQTIGISKEL